VSLVARRPIAIAVCLAALAASVPARADPPPPDETHPVLLGLIAFGILVMPSDIGFFVSDQRPDPTLAWSWQIPVTESRRHRVLIGLDWIPTSKAETARGRLGYRYANKNLIAGLALAYAQGDTTWSPEIGLRFGPERRADIAAAFDGFRGVALLLGWDMF
jgi:hypothetical protein